MARSEVDQLDALLASPEAVFARKRPVAMRVRFAAADGICASREGPVRFREGDAIVTGVEGEQWPVDAARFRSIYQPADVLS